EGVQVESQNYEHAGKSYVLVNALGSQEVPDGKYLYDPASKQIEIQWIQGIGSDAAPAPQARLMATVINGILTQRLPWRLVLLGVFLVVTIELLGVRSLAFAVGSYLSIATTMAIFAGGAVRWLAERNKPRTAEAESEVSPGALYSSGLIAAGGVVGLLAIIIKLMEIRGWATPDKFNVGTRWIGGLATNGWLGVVMFLLLASSLFVFARKKLE
ncbi:MAG TPA: OPT/YSL family transporter, partial [Candidatus Acidoferrales bacterium]|nr:OPT/YSL family transporter [Candidatus Acidoferrales bacterium]